MSPFTYPIRQRRALTVVGVGCFLAACDAAFAQGQPTLTVTFSSGTPTIPIARWLVALIAAAISLSVLIIYRGDVTSRFGKIRSLIAIATIGAALVLGVRSGEILRDANAQITPTPFPLFTSPESIPIDAVPNRYLVSNQTGAAIKIIDMRVTNDRCVDTAYPPSTCKAGEVLQPLDSCLIGIQSFPAPCPPQ